MQQDLWKQPVTELSALMARKALSPVELLQMYSERQERLNPALNAIVAFDHDGALAAAKAAEARMLAGARLGPLDGVPVTVKDNLFVRGMPATWGSRLFADHRPEQDDLVVARLRAAGALIVGKTNTPELALASHTDNLVFGKTRNPWDLALTPGGSSGGAVAAVAAGLAPLAIGTDAGGSIRRPAGYTGLVGLRPSTGRIARCYGFPALAHDFQVIGPAARTVEDLYALLRAVAGADARDRASLAFAGDVLPAVLPAAPRLRIRYIPAIGTHPIDAPIRAAIARAAQQLAALGHQVAEGAAPFDPDEIDRIRAVLSGAAVARVVSVHDGWRERVGRSVAEWTDNGLQLSAVDHVRALDALNALRVRVAGAFDTVDVLLTASSTAMPWPVEQPFPPQIDGRAAGARASGLFSGFVNAAGLPAISVPVTPSGAALPIGMQLIGAYGAELQLLQVAHEYEQAHPWAERWPAFAG